MSSAPRQHELADEYSSASLASGGLHRVFDTCCAFAGLLLLSPLFCVIAIAIKLDDGGRVLYLQPRVGMPASRGSGRFFAGTRSTNCHNCSTCSRGICS